MTKRSSRNAKKFPSNFGLSEDNLFYNINGKLMPRVSNAIDMLPAPWLKAWYGSLGTKKALFVLEDLQNRSPIMCKLVQNSLPSNFFQTARERKEELAEVGTKVHDLIARDLAGKSVIVPDEPDVKTCFAKYKGWKSNHRIKPVRLEFTVYSKRYGVAGTVDALLIVDGKLGIYDWKTGAQRPGAIIQASSYKCMATTLMRGTRIKEVKIVYFYRMGKFNEERDIVDVPVKDCHKNFKVLRGMMDAWRWDWAYTHVN